MGSLTKVYFKVKFHRSVYDNHSPHETTQHEVSHVPMKSHHRQPCVYREKHSSFPLLSLNVNKTLYK